jgi:iron complex outermembrane receptor protein
MKRIILSVIFYLTFIQLAFAQQTCNLILRGKVVHLENNEPIEGAYIWLITEEKGAISDQQGNFRIQGICPGKVILKTQYLGHKEHLDTLEISANINYTIRLAAEDLRLEGVEIHGHQDALLTSNAISSIYGEFLRESRGQNLGETLRRIPGVTSYSSGQSIQKPVIHGLHSNRILIMNNGVRLEGQQWGAEHAPEIDPFLAKEIAVVKGAETVRFGPEAMGGVILVNPAPLPLKPEFSGEFDLIGFSNGRGLNAAAMVQGGSNKIRGLGYRLQTSSKIAGNIQTPGYMLDNTGVREFNFSGALGYSSSRLGAEVYFSHFQSTIGILSDSHTGNLSDLESIIENGRPFRDAVFSYHINNPKQEVDHQLFKLKAHYHLHEGAKLNLQYAFQRNHRQEFDRRRGELNNRASLDMELFTNTLDFSFAHQTGKNWDGSIGISLMQQANSNIPGTGVTPLIPNFDMWNLGFYAIEKFTKGPIEVEGGLRYDFRNLQSARFVNRELEQYNLDFRNFSSFLGGVYTFDRNWTFSTNIATAWRPPNVNELFSQGLHHGLAAIELGNPEFVSEESYKWLNSINFEKGNFTAELTAYINKINNFIYLSPREEQFVSLRGTFNVFEYLQTDALLYGADLSAKWQITEALEFFSRSSLIRANDLINEGFLPFIPADRTENGLTFIFLKNPKSSGPKVTVSNLFVARQKREPDFDFAPAPHAYALWNLGLSKAFQIKDNKLNLGIQVQNLFDQSYRDYMNRFRYFTDEIGRNLFIKLNYEF